MVYWMTAMLQLWLIGIFYQSAPWIIKYTIIKSIAVVYTLSYTTLNAGVHLTLNNGGRLIDCLNKSEPIILWGDYLLHNIYLYGNCWYVI